MRAELLQSNVLHCIARVLQLAVLGGAVAAALYVSRGVSTA